MPRILVVEDNEHLVRIYGERLANEGFDVTIAENGIQAVNLTREILPDVILLDLMLPKMDGYEVLVELKSDPDIQQIPVVVLSNKGWDEDIRRALALGARTFYSKGMTPTGEIIRELRAIVGMLKFLVIDSNPATSGQIEEVVRSAGQASAVCRLPVEAPMRVKRDNPDVIFVNPNAFGAGVHGIAVVQRIKTMPEAQRIPLVLYGESDSPPPGMIGPGRGDAWLPLPTSQGELAAVLQLVRGEPAAR